MTNPHTTIIIPYNEDRGWLDKAIESAEAQPGCKVRPIKGDGTVGQNLNIELRQLTTEFWCQLDEDDLLTPHSVASRLAYMKDADFVHARALNLYTDGSTSPYTMTNPHTTFKSCLDRNGIFGSSGLYRADLIDKYGYWREDLTTGEEWEYHLRLLSKGCRLAFCPDVVYLYRRHDKQKSLGVGVDQAKRKLIHLSIKKEYDLA